MSRFKTTPIPASFHNGVVFKRKGSRVRYIDPATAKVSPWVAAPEVMNATDDALRAVEREVPVVPDMAAHYRRMTVAELRALAGAMGLKIPSKARKADIIIALTED